MLCRRLPLDPTLLYLCDKIFLSEWRFFIFPMIIGEKFLFDDFLNTLLILTKGLSTYFWERLKPILPPGWFKEEYKTFCLLDKFFFNTVKLKLDDLLPRFRTLWGLVFMDLLASPYIPFPPRVMIPLRLKWLRPFLFSLEFREDLLAWKFDFMPLFLVNPGFIWPISIW